MTILIVYYSWTGHTETVAQKLAEKLNAPAIRIEPETDPGPGMFMKAISAFLKQRKPIKLCQTDLSGIDHLVIATPVWSGKIPPYTREYCERLTGCSGKKFSVLAEMGGRGADSAIAAVRNLLESKGMIFAASASTLEKDVEAKQVDTTLDNFAKQILPD